MGINFRTLKANEIDVRVQSVTQKGAILLLYKDARCDMNILDETVGCMNWQRRHYEVKGNLHCEVSLYDETKGHWIAKADCGTESFTEKEKGEASDSFKRACFNWGIGRELYTSPFIFVKATDMEIKEVDGDRGKKKYITYDKFAVEKIVYDDNKNIIGLAIKNTSKNKRAYTLAPPKESK